MSQNEEISRETTRQVAALFQITAAIEHFQKHEVECAITLQSAVEGVVVPLVGRLALRLRQRLLGFNGNTLNPHIFFVSVFVAALVIFVLFVSRSHR